MSSTRSRLALTWFTVVDAWLRIGWLCSRTWRMVSVVSSRVRPSFISGTANRRTSNTKARAAISPAHSPADTRALPLFDFRQPVPRLGSRPGPARSPAGGATLVAGPDGRRRLPGARSAAAADDRPQLGHPGGQRRFHPSARRPVVVAADQAVR